MKEKNYQLLMSSVWLLYIGSAIGTIIYNLINDYEPTITQNFTGVIILYSFSIGYALINTLALIIITLKKVKVYPEIIGLISTVGFILLGLSILTTRNGVTIIFIPFFVLLAILFLCKELIIKKSNILKMEINENTREESVFDKNQKSNIEIKNFRVLFYFSYLCSLLLELGFIYSISKNQNVFSLGNNSFIVYVLVLVLFEFCSIYVKIKIIYFFKVDLKTNFDIKLHKLCKATIYIPFIHYFFWIPCFIIKSVRLKKRGVFIGKNLYFNETQTFLNE